MTTAVDKWPAAARLVAVAAAGHLPTAPTPPQGTRPHVPHGSHCQPALPGVTPKTGALFHANSQTRRWREVDSTHRATRGRWIRTLGPALHTHRFGPPLVGSVTSRSPKRKSPFRDRVPSARSPLPPPSVPNNRLRAFRWRVTDVAADGAISAHRSTGRRGRFGARPRRSPTASRNSSKSNTSAWAAPTAHERALRRTESGEHLEPAHAAPGRVGSV